MPDEITTEPISAIEAIYGKPQPQVEPETPEAPEQEAAPETPETAEASPEAPESPDAAETEEVEISTVAELAEHFELDQEWLKTLRVSDKVRGDAVDFSIADALATHRKVQAADSYLSEAKTRSKALIDEATQQKEAWATSVAVVNKLLQSVESEISRDSKLLLSDKLKEEDPALYAVRQNEIRDRRERLESLKREAQQGVQEIAQKTMSEQVNAMNQRLPQEREALIERVPEWADEAKAAAERKEVVPYLTKEGFQHNDILAIAYNGRALALAVKAMRYDASKAKLATIKKKVVKIPKVLKPGPKKVEAPKPNGAEKADPVSILYG